MTPALPIPLSRRDRILAFICEYVETYGYPPTVREIAAAVGLLSSSTVHQHLDVLERDGAIRRDRTKPRALRVLVPASDHHEET